MLPFGAIILARFPFTDLTGDKRRPALVVSAGMRGSDVVVCFITSRPQAGPHSATIVPAVSNGLKVVSLVMFDKIATLHESVVSGVLGEASTDWLSVNAAAFQAVFGFSRSA